MEDNSAPEYVVGHGAEELQRLEAQAEFFRPVTRSLFLQAGIGEGQRVLDFGCGVGDVSFLAAEIVGSQGDVIGIDRSVEALAVARARAEQRGATNVRFLQGDESLVGTAALEEGSFDAVVGRLVMMHQRDPVSTLRQLARALRCGGVLAIEELNLASGGASSPRLPLFEKTWEWCLTAAKLAHVDIEMGIRLPTLCRAAGFADVEADWMGRLMPGNDPMTFECFAGITRSLLPLLERSGVVTAQEVGIETLAARMHAEGTAANGTVAYVTSVGVRARKP